jgi:hypothetical protein
MIGWYALNYFARCRIDDGKAVSDILGSIKKISLRRNREACGISRARLVGLLGSQNDLAGEFGGAAEAGIVIAKVRSTEEFFQEQQYQQVLQHMPLISVEKIADGDPQPLAAGASTALEDIRALGMAHVIAGAGIGRDLASFGADVLNLWRPDDSEVEAMYWDTQVGMRSAYLSDTGDDRAKLDELLREYHFHEIHSLRVHASPQRVFQAIREVRPEAERRRKVKLT